jgi:hypothetical protein
MYANALTDHLGISNYEWMSEKELEEFDVEKVSEDDSIGYIVTADLLYDNSLHDRDILLPLCVSKRIIEPTELSKSQLSSFDNF